MDGQDQKTTTAISAGHEGHGVHTCHRCGWPFPNPHPSAKHRRAHKKVCGTIEGYKIIQSEDDDSRLAVSVEEHASDDDVHTPSPTLVKRKSLEVSGSGGIGERSSKSEDDEFCDAVAEFSDGGKSQTMDSPFDSVIGIEKSTEQTGVEFPSQLLKVDETDDKTELIDPTSNGEISNPGALTNANDGSEQVVFLMDNVDIVNAETLVGLRDSIQPEPTKEDILASETTESENKISDPRLISLEGKKDVSDNLTSHMVKHADFPEAETPENIDTSAEEQSVANSVELADSTKTAAENILSKGTHENSDTSMVKKVSDSAVVEDTSIKLSDEDSMVSFLAKNDKGETYLNEVENVDNSGSSGVEKQDTDGNINENLESDKFPTETISATGLVGDSFATENDLTACTMEQIVNNSDGKSNDVVLSDGGNEMGSETSKEILRELDRSMPSESSNPLPFSHEVDTNAIYLDELSKTESTLELRESGLGKSFESNDTDKETETLSVGSAGLAHDAVDSVYKNPPNTTSEDSALPVISELPKSNDMPSDVIVESINVGGLVYESEQDIHVATSEKTREHPISKDSITLSSETVDADEVTNEQNLDRNIVADYVKSDNSVVRVLALPVKEECSDETITETNGHEGEVVNAEKSVVPVANLSSEDRQPASPSGFQDSQKTSVKCEDENTDNLEHDDGAISKPLQDKSDEKVTEEKNDAPAKELSGALSSRCDSLEANYGSVSALSQSSDTLETKNEKQKQTDIETPTDKSEVFEPPSFMTLVLPSAKPNQETGTTSEIGTVHHNQSDSLQAGWFPSLSNVVNESEGRKKNEEIIAKVTNWSPVKQHSPLKTLFNEVKSPNTKQVPTSHEKQEGEIINKGAADSTTVKPFPGNETKNMDEWDSPARYPIETKKEKKKKKPYWVPFVCCSSVHGDL